MSLFATDIHLVSSEKSQNIACSIKKIKGGVGGAENSNFTEIF